MLTTVAHYEFHLLSSCLVPTQHHRGYRNRWSLPALINCLMLILARLRQDPSDRRIAFDFIRF